MFDKEQKTTAVTSVGILREHQEVVLGAEAEQVWKVPSGPNGKMSSDRYGYLSGSSRFQEQHQRNLFGGVQLRPCVYTDVK